MNDRLPTIRIHNSLTGEKETLKPIVPGQVGMYSCGITVYDYLHVGHARMLLVFDLVARYLRHRGYKVKYVRNITDIDDKIIRRAAEKGETIQQLSQRFIDAMDEDCAKLGLLKPDVEPRATEFIDEIVSMIGSLIDNGYAYVASNGDVMYSVSEFEEYGQLSGKVLADLRAGSRVEVDEAKRDPLDFVLWKKAKPNEPSWESPWGAGRPGWHIECSAMSTAELGETFDIHGGGLDLKFPHHENEIAQTCGATGAKFAEIWMHNGFLNIDNEKMSKSLGNFFTTREVLAKIKHPEVLRFFLLSSHYRGPMNYSPDQLGQAEAGLNRLYTALRDVPEVGGELYSPTSATQVFDAAMDDDFNTPEAIAALQGLARELNTVNANPANSHKAKLLAGELRALGGVLGILRVPPEVWFRTSAGAAAGGLSDAEIDALIEARNAARKAKNWAESDRIRAELAAAGVILEDKPGGATTWRRA